MNPNTMKKILISLNLFIGNSGAVDGFELGSFINTDNYYMNGFQGAGFLNVVGGPVTGVQLAGFGNVSGGITHGAQLSGFFNVAKEIDAVQVAGFINICDSIDGVPIGVINIVRNNGYRHFVFSMSETQYFNMSYRMGVRKLYSIFSFGKLTGTGGRWIYGYGLGTEFDLNEKLQMNIEAVSHQELWIGDSRARWPLQTDRLNMLNQGRVLFNFKPNEKINLFVGPTLNVAVSETSPYIGDIPYYEIGPNWAFFDRTGGYNDINVKVWIGITAGITL